MPNNTAARAPKSTRPPPLFQFIVEPANDLPGQWLATCLELGVMSQGDSLHDAVECLCEAVTIVLQEGDISQYRKAPQENWDTFLAVMTKGERMDLKDIVTHSDRKVVLAGYLTLKPSACVPQAWELSSSKFHGPSHLQA